MNQIQLLKAETTEERAKHIRQFDQQLKSINIPGILLDRLKKEFDDSHSLSTQFGR